MLKLPELGMPELPEAETIARGLHRCLKGKTITGVKTRTPKLREKLNPRKLRADTAGGSVEGVSRRGKAIVARLDNGQAILIQLGMTGACRVCGNAEPLKKHEHVIFDLSGKTSWRFEDPRRFGMVKSFSPLTSEPKFLRELGPDPLEKDFSAEYLFKITRRRSRAIKEVLLDQKIVAGIGNIYDSELLFRAGIRPRRAAGRLSKDDCNRIVRESRRVLEEAIKAGGTTIGDYRSVDGSEGRFVRRLRVYGRAGEPCIKCKTSIKKIVTGGRATFYCPKCQK